MPRSHNNKPQEFLLSRKQGSIVLSIGVAVGIALMSYVFVATSAPDRPPATRVVAENGIVRIPIAHVGPAATFFEYHTRDSKAVRFLVIRSSDGVYRTAADACKVCYRDKRGYHQQGNDIVCQKCGHHSASNSVNEATGGCDPIAIQRTIQGDSLLIATADLEAHAVLF